eukprot:360151-Chlamydomonas_euryale.AAC.1
MPLLTLVVAALHCCPDGSPAGRNASCTKFWWRRARAAVWLAVRHSGKEAERRSPRPLPLQAADPLNGLRVRDARPREEGESLATSAGTGAPVGTHAV